MPEERKPKLKAVQSLENEADLSGLWIDTELGDPLAETVRHKIPFGKPRDFFRTHPSKLFRRKAEIYRHKTEGSIEEDYYILDKPMQGLLEEAALYILIACVYRDGTPRLWPIRLPRDGERDNESWVSQRMAASVGLTKWVKLIWDGRGFVRREAKPGYGPENYDWKGFPEWHDLVTKAVGPQGIIHDTAHPVYRDLVGEKPSDSDAGNTDDL